MGLDFALNLDASDMESSGSSALSLLADIKESVTQLATAAKSLSLRVSTPGAVTSRRELQGVNAEASRMQQLFARASNLGAGLSNVVAGAQAVRTAYRGIASTNIRQMLGGPEFRRAAVLAVGLATAVGTATVAYRTFRGAAGAAASVAATPFRIAEAAARRANSAVATTNGGIRNMMSGMSSSSGMLLGGGAAFAAGAGAYKALDLGAAAEKTEVGINTILKNTNLTKGLLNNLRSLAEQTPLEMPELTGAARTMLGGGWSISSVLQDLKMMGDVSSGAQTDLGGLVQVINQVKGKGQMYAEELQQFAERGVSGLREAMAKVRGTSTGQLFEDMKEGAVTVDDLMKAFRSMAGTGGIYFQSMTNQARTTYGMISTIKDNVRSLVTVFSTPGNDALKPMLQATINMLGTARVRAQQFMSALSIAVANGRVGDFLYTSLKLAFSKAANYGNSVLAGIGAGLAGLDKTFDFLKDKALWEAGANYLGHALEGAANRFLKAFTAGYRTLNAALNPLLRSRDSDLANAQLKFGMNAGQAERKRDEAGGDIAGRINAADIVGKLWKGISSFGTNFNAGMGAATPVIDTAKMEATLKDFYSAGRSEYEKARGEENRALEQATRSTNGAAAAATTLSQNMQGTKDQMDALSSKLRGTPGGGPGEGGGDAGMPGGGSGSGRKRIRSNNAEESLMRQFMRLSPQAMSKYDNSFGAAFGKGQKLGPEAAYQNFLKQNGMQRSSAMSSMRRGLGAGPPPPMELMAQLNKANSRAFGGISGRRDNGKGTTTMEKILAAIEKNTEGLKAQ